MVIQFSLKIQRTKYITGP